MLVTPNWSVNPTPATARIEAVTMPNPIAGTSVLTGALPRCRGGPPDRSRSPAERRDLCGRNRAGEHELAVHVLRCLERTGGVVPAVEDDRPARAHVLDLLPG